MAADGEGFVRFQEDDKTELNTSDSNERFYQAVLLGDFGIGKSSIFFRFKTGEYTNVLDDHGFDQESRVFKKGGKEVTLQLCDTAGLERAGDMTSGYFRTAHAVILVYDCTDLESLLSLKQRWVENCLAYCSPNALYFVVGTKIDEAADIAVDKNKPKAFFENEEIKIQDYFRISAKANTNFDSFIQGVIEHLMNNSGERPRKTTVTLKSHYEEKSKCGCK